MTMCGGCEMESRTATGRHGLWDGDCWCVCHKEHPGHAYDPAPRSQGAFADDPAPCRICGQRCDKDEQSKGNTWSGRGIGGRLSAPSLGADVSPKDPAKSTVALALLLAVLLAGCAPSKKRPPVVPEKPPAEQPAPQEPPKEQEKPVECATCCPADAPEATGYRWYQGNKANPDVKMVCAIAVTHNPEWCKARFEDPRQHGTCSYFEECDPRKPNNGCEKRDSCLKTKGRPTFTGPISVRADNPICGDVGVGETITACAPSGACGSYTVTP